MNIALVTFQDHGAYHDSGIQNEDDLLLNFLTSKGVQLEKAIWNDTNVDWKSYDVLIIKSPWDYFNLINDFYNWLNTLKSLSVKVLNPIAIMEWNADKHYLQDIEKAGLKVTPSIFLSKGRPFELKPYFEQFHTKKLIIKPCVSGGSKNTLKVTEDNLVAVNAQLEIFLAEEDFIVQPFLAEIEENGEWSFLFFGGKFSHALLKKAKSGDFRVQSIFGGSIHPQDPPPELLSKAHEYVDQFAKNCLYARVDGAVVNNEFMLMELELIEPFLFLDTEPKSLENYYEALVRVLGV